MTKLTQYFSAVILTACATVSLQASAATIITQFPQGSYVANSLTGSNWTTFTNALTAQHSLTQVSDFSNLSQLQNYSAAWVNQELYSTLSSGEISSLQSYISSGHKAVFIGENNSWNNWNSSLMSIVGGSFNGVCSWSTGTALVSNTLTAGVGSVGNVCGSTINSTPNAQILFSNNMAALYKVGSGEALVILDSNWNDNGYGNTANNMQFANNVITWIGTPIPAVPEPETYALFAVGLMGIAAVARRRKA